MDTKIGCPQVLDGVKLSCLDHRLLIGGGHAKVKGGDRGIPRLILAGYVDAGLQFIVVNGKASYFVHDKFLLN